MKRINGAVLIRCRAQLKSIHLGLWFYDGSYLYSHMPDISMVDIPMPTANRVLDDELGADEKVVQRILRHAKSHVTKERYIKAFDPAVLAAMRKLETSLDVMSQRA